VLSDLHIGYEGEMHKKGVLVPKTQFKQIMQELEKIFAVIEKKKWTCKRIVLNGDVKHDFGRISEQEWREILRLIDYLLKKGEVIVVEGNHDPVLQPIAAKRDIRLVKDVQVGQVLIHHGDTLIDVKNYKNPKIIVMGHEHPALCLSEGARKERFKCFLKGTYRRRTLLCLPSFNPLTMGTDMLREKTLSPLLDRDLSNFEAWIAADQIYYFGKLKDI